MQVKLTPQNIEAIERAISQNKRAEATVKLEDGKPVVLLVEKKKIS